MTGSCYKTCESSSEEDDIFSTPTCTPVQLNVLALTDKDSSMIGEKPFRAHGNSTIPSDINLTLTLRTTANPTTLGGPAIPTPTPTPTTTTTTTPEIPTTAKGGKGLVWLDNLAGHVDDPNALDMVSHMEGRVNCISKKKVTEVGVEEIGRGGMGYLLRRRKWSETLTNSRRKKNRTILCCA
jgi:hypothetical protein